MSFFDILVCIIFTSLFNVNKFFVNYINQTTVGKDVEDYIHIDTVSNVFLKVIEKNKNTVGVALKNNFN
mgnify:CR=1 FL=1